MTRRTRENFTGSLSAKQLVELDACTRCGDCLRNCPVQEVTGDKSVSPPEKIRMYREFIKSTSGLKSMIFGRREVDRKLLEEFVRAVFECTTCGACGHSCTVGIDTQRLWPMLRREMVKRGLGPIGPQRDLPRHVETTGNVYGKPAAERFVPWFPEGSAPVERAHIGYYAGCTGAYEAQSMVRGDVLVLSASGEPFTMLDAEEEVCCGFPLFITGQFDMLEGLVKRLVTAYQEKGVETLLCSCPCCVSLMAKEWPLLYGGELPFRIRHITQFASKAMADGRLRLTTGFDGRAIYHDPCYLSRGVGVIEEPREVLRGIPGLELIEFEQHGMESRCCGAGGAARKVFHENAIAIARLSIDEAWEKKADRLVLSCPACYEKVNEAMADYDKQVQRVDIMELLAGCL